MTKLVLLTALTLLVSSAGAAAPQKARKPVTHSVVIDATSFQPASLTIAAGDSVIWNNKDVIPHTATSSKAGVFDSGTIAAGGSFKLIFKTKADLAYVCQFHPAMKGRLKIE